MDLTLSFFGGAGTVTGSRYLLETPRYRALLDCGLFQGLKQLRLRNWAPFPVQPSTIDSIVLTHAHLDHSGCLPALIGAGYAGRVHCSPATRDLCGILLPDSGYLQEKDADYANRHGFSKHKPALPLYTLRDAERALGHFAPVDFETDHPLGDGATFRLRRAGHILGAAIVEVSWKATTIVFSGDLGRYDDPMMVDPAPIRAADYLIVESTYGDRRHDRRDPEEALAEIVSRTVGRGGTVVIPAFAVGRAQSLLLHFDRLKSSGRLPNVPIFLDILTATDCRRTSARRTMSSRRGHRRGDGRDAARPPPTTHNRSRTDDTKTTRLSPVRRHAARRHRRRHLRPGARSRGRGSPSSGTGRGCAGAGGRGAR